MESTRIKSKEEFTLPKGAEIIRKDCTTNVEEIENGFIINKSFDLEYKLGDRTDYRYFTKRWYSKENPVKINLPKEVKSFAENL